MRLWRNRRGQTVAENRREALDDTTRRWHRMEILIEATEVEFDAFSQAIADAAFDAEPEGTDAYVSAQSNGVLAPSEDGMILTITDKGDLVDLHVAGLSLSNYVTAESPVLNLRDQGLALLDVTLLVDKVQLGEREMVEVQTFDYSVYGGPRFHTVAEPKKFGR